MLVSGDLNAVLDFSDQVDDSVHKLINAQWYSTLWRMIPKWETFDLCQCRVKSPERYWLQFYHQASVVLKHCAVTDSLINFRRRHWQATSPIAIDVTVLWSLSVCLSRSSIVLKRQKISTWFLLYATGPCFFQSVLEFGLHRSIFPSPNFAPKWSTPVDLSVGDIPWQIAAEEILHESRLYSQNTIALSNDSIANGQFSLHNLTNSVLRNVIVLIWFLHVFCSSGALCPNVE